MKTLLVGYKASDLFETRKHGKRTTATWALDAGVTCHCIDIYDRHAIEKVHHIKAVCAPNIPEGDWDVIKFKTGPKLMSGELALDLLQQCHILAGKTTGSEGRKCSLEVEFVGKERDRNDLLAKIADDPSRVRDFSAKWKASVPGGKPMEFTSFPGCFCHRRLDEGGLALAEVVTRELSTPVPRAPFPVPRSPFPVPRSPFPIKILDMGCGCGLVGFLIAGAVGNVELVMVDSSSRATQAAELNSKNLGIPAEVVLADNGMPTRMDGTFDVFVGNPPYYSDYRIADVFLETALRALKPGGACYTVCKNAAGLETVQAKYFPSVEIIKRRGYAVLKSVKPL